MTERWMERQMPGYTTVQVKKNPHIFCFMKKFQGEIAEFLRENMEFYR